MIHLLVYHLRLELTNSFNCNVKDSGAYLEHKTAGIQSVTIQNEDLNNYQWGYQVMIFLKPDFHATSVYYLLKPERQTVIANKFPTLCYGVKIFSSRLGCQEKVHEFLQNMDRIKFNGIGFMAYIID